MRDINAIRKFNWAQGKRDDELILEVARRTNQPPEIVALDFGFDSEQFRQDDPGFLTAAQNSLYSFAGAAGQVAQDLTGGRVGHGLEQFGDLGQYRNPITLMDGDSDSAFKNVVSNFWNDPIGSTGQALGAAVGYMGPQGAAKLGLTGYRAARGIQAAAAPSTAMRAAGAAGTAGYYGLPSYGVIRDAQEEKGHNDPIDMLAAGAGAASIGLLEGRFGPEAWISRGVGAGIGGPGKTFVHTGLKTGGIEALEEMSQAPIERAASYDDVLSMETLDQMAAGGVVGLAAGTPMGMAAHPFMRKPVNTTDTKDLLGGQTPPPAFDGRGELFPEDTGYAGPVRPAFEPEATPYDPNVDMGPYAPYYDTTRNGGQMSFLDDLPSNYSPIAFDPNLADDPQIGLAAEARQFENEQGGVSGYRAALEGAPGTFKNVPPRRDFALPGDRVLGDVTEQQTPEQFAQEQGLPPKMVQAAQPDYTARLDELRALVKDKKNPPSARGLAAMQAEIEAIKARMVAEKAVAAAEKKQQSAVARQQKIAEKEAAKAAKPAGLRNILQGEFDRALQAGEITEDNHIELTNDLDMGSGSLAVKANKLRKALNTMKAERSKQASLPGVPSAGLAPAAETQQGPFTPDERYEPTAEEDAANRGLVNSLFAQLSDKERAVIDAYHGGDMDTLQEVGYRLDPQKEKRREAILSSGKPAEQIKKELASLDSAARNDAARTRERAKAKLLEMGKELGVTEEALETYFGDESRRLQGGADVKTANAGEVAQMGTAMHVPGGVEGLGIDNEPVGEENNMRDLGTGDQDLMRLDQAEPDVMPDGRLADEVTDDDAGDTAQADETTEIQGVELRGLVDYRGREIDPEDAQLALDRWEDLDGTPLPEDFRPGWIKAFVNHKYGGMSDERYGDVYAITSERVAAEGRAVPQTGERSPVGDGDRVGGSPAGEAGRSDGEVAPARDAARQPEEQPRREVTRKQTPKAVPKAFLARIEVETNVYNEATDQFTRERVKADKALAANKADIDTFKQLVKCLGG